MTDAEKPKSNLGKRVLTGAIGIPIVLGSIIFVPGGFGLLGISFVVSAVAMLEYLQLVQISWSRPAAIVSMIFALGVWVAAVLFFHFQIPVLGYLPVLLLLPPVLALALMVDRHAKRPFQTLGLLLLGVYFVVLPFVLFYGTGFVLNSGEVTWRTLAEPSYHFHYARPLWVLLMTWVADTGAYFAGKAFGKHKLWVRISPGKTWEGAAGGFLVTVGMGLALDLWWAPSNINWMFVGVVVVVFSILGDLLESLLKRSLGAKDSSGLLPGHGGILDRVDGLLLVMPVIAYYFYTLSV